MIDIYTALAIAVGVIVVGMGLDSYFDHKGWW